MPKTLAKEIAVNVIKAALAKTGWTPNHLAERMGVSHTTITRILNNPDASAPNFTTIVGVAEAAGLSLFAGIAIEPRRLEEAVCTFLEILQERGIISRTEQGKARIPDERLAAEFVAAVLVDAHQEAAENAEMGPISSAIAAVLRRSPKKI